MVSRKDFQAQVKIKFSGTSMTKVDLKFKTKRTLPVHYNFACTLHFTVVDQSHNALFEKTKQINKNTMSFIASLWIRQCKIVTPSTST